MIGRRRRRVRHGPGPLAGPAIGPVADAADVAAPAPEPGAGSGALEDPGAPRNAGASGDTDVSPDTGAAGDAGPARATAGNVANATEAAADTKADAESDAAGGDGGEPGDAATDADAAVNAATDADADADADTVAQEVWISEGGPPPPPEVEAQEVAVAGEEAGAGDAGAAVASPSGWRRVFDLRRARNAVAMVGLALLAFGTGLVVFNNVVMPRLVHSVNEQRIPDLTNLSVDQAEKNLSARGLALSRAGERFDPSVPRGFILSQDPPAETPIRGKRRVTVIVSMGEEFSSVPELFGESVRTAQYLLERAGLRLGGVTRAPSEEVGEGLVAATDPPAESVLPRDGAVSLLVSTGGGEERFVMPDVLGREIGGARRQLEAFGFRVSTPPAAPSVGTIVFQDPAPGASITRSTPIVLQATGRIIR